MYKQIALVGTALFLVGTVYVYAPHVFHSVDKGEVIQSKPILFLGDTMLGRYVETLGEQYENDAFMFASTSDFLKEHTTIANLEGPIPTLHTVTPINGFSFSFPSSTPEILSKNGITAVSLANNHMFDQGKDGWEETKLALEKGNVHYFGGYVPTQSDYFETKIGDKDVVVYGITMIATGWDEIQALEVTKKLRSEHKDSYLIAFLHWGDEYQTQNIYQENFAHKLVDLGVDAIVGSHPHVVQGIELYRGRPIFYSLGNFIFDQYWAKNVQRGLAVELSMEGTSFVYTLFPIISAKSVPSVAQNIDRQEILDTIIDQSDASLAKMIASARLVIPK